MFTRATARLSELLLHPRLRTEDTEQAFVGRVSVWLILGGLVGAIFVNVYLLTGGGARIVWAQVAFLVSVLAAPIFTRWLGTVRAVLAYVVGLTWIMVSAVTASTGGATSSALYLYALVPFFGGALGGYRGGAVGAALALTSTLVFYSLHLAGVRLPTTGVYALMIDPPSIAAATLLIYLISAGFVRSRQDALGRLAANTRRVSGANTRAEEARAELERAHAAKLVALTRVGDGLHTPLARISGAARRLHEDLPPHLHDHATMVARSAEQLLAKLDAFVVYTAAWAAEPGSVAAFDVEAVARDVAAAHASAAVGKRNTLEAVVDGAAPGVRRGDRPRIERILNELMDNAIKYTSGGEVTLALRVLDGERVRFEVRDTGAGIAAADRDRVFEPLYRVDATTTRREGGTGLGLAVARRLAEGLGGSLTCASDVGAGTRMVLTIPLPSANGSPRGQP
jgi:signal transduction histidine kinase